MVELQIDEEFKNVLPPLTEDQFQQLEENILREGILNPIITWNGIIVDGHNRYTIAKKHPELTFAVKEMDFDNRYAVIDWIITHQKGQRNLTEAQWTNMIGLLLEVRKLAKGGQEGNQNASKNECANFAHLNSDEPRKHSGRTSEEIGKEFGIAARTVDDAYAFHQGIETIKQEDPSVANDILEGKISVPKRVIQGIRKADEEDVKETVKSIKDGTIKRKHKSKEQMSKDKELMSNIMKDIEKTRTVNECVVLTIDSFVRDIKNNSTSYIRLFNQLITAYADVIRQNKDIAICTIDDCIIGEINNLKERIRNDY